MPGTLYVVATPIGNLEDITLRALRVLREAALIAAEDTRRTAKLLAAHGIATRTVSLHQHNTRAHLPRLLDRLRAGENVVLVSDAGTPCVSDPGVELIRACLDEGIRVDPIPGASAPLTAAVASGFPLTPLSIFGFAPHRAKDRREWLVACARTPHTFTFFETPHRIEETLKEMDTVLGIRQIVLARELTKAHQEIIRGNSAEVSARLREPRGEFTVVVGPSAVDEPQIEVSDEQVVAEFGRIADSGVGSRRDAIAAVASRYGRKARDVYAVIERNKHRHDSADDH